MTIIEVLRKLNIRFVQHGEHHHVTAGWYGIDCPLCSPNSLRFRMGIAKNGRGASCWVCGGKQLGSTLAMASGKDLREVLELTKGLEKEFEEEQHPGRLVIPKGVIPMMPLHKKYLYKRGFNPDEISETWGVQAIPKHERLPWRLFIPITLRNEVVSWTTRSITDYADGRHPEAKGRNTSHLRYVNARSEEEAVPARDVLYGADLATHAITIHEGPTDAWRIGRGGTAIMGLNVSKEQLLAISSFPLRIVCFDNEPEAQRRAHKLCEQLTPLPGSTIRVQLRTAKDAASAQKSEVLELRQMIA